MSLFSSLRSSATGLYTTQLRLDLTSTNITRADDPHYSRQRARIESIGYRDVGPGAVGMGIEISQILRNRDSFIDARYRRDQADASRHEHLTSSMGHLETIFGELNAPGLGSTMDEFWDGWNELANSPTDATVRSSLLGKARQLARSFSDLHGQLSTLAVQNDRELAATVDRINGISARIANLNVAINSAQDAGGKGPNTLLDERDALLDELAELTGVTTGTGPQGLMVFTDGLTLVNGPSVHPLTLQDALGGNAVAHEILYATDGTRLQPSTGRLAGLLEARDEIVPQVFADLDEIAATLVEQVNAIHRTGHSADGLHRGNDFFIGTGAASIVVNPYIDVDAARIASSASGLAGDNEIALQIADLREAPVLRGSSIGDSYNQLLLAVGLASEEAQFSHSLAAALAAQTGLQREGVKGVNLDEEMVDLISLQNAYQASARVVETIDELIQTTLGLVG